MRLKTMLLAIMMAVAPMTVVAQVPADVQQIIDEANAYLPVDAGGGMTMTSLGYDHSSLVYTLEFDDDPQGLTINMMDSKVLKQSMLNTLKGNDDASVHALFQVMESHDLGMTYAFHGRRSKKTILVSLTLDEVRNALGSAPSPTSKGKLQGTIDMINAMYPMKVNEYLTMLRVDVVTDTVFYVYEIDEQYASIDDIAVIRDTLAFAIRRVVDIDVVDVVGAVFYCSMAVGRVPECDTVTVAFIFGEVNRNFLYRIVHR